MDRQRAGRTAGAAVAAAMAALLLARPAPVAACSCFGGDDVLPPRGAVDVPRDTRVVTVAGPRGLVFHVPKIELHVAGESEAVAASVEIRTREDRRDHLLVLRPDDPLEPNTTYEVRVNDGPSSSFTTGEGFAGPGSGPGFSGLEDFAAEAMALPGNSAEDCIVRRDGMLHRLRIEHAGAGNVADYLLLEVERPDAPDWSDFVPLLAARDLSATSIQSHLCSPRPPALEVGATYCARLVAYDLAGNRSGGEPTLCAQVERCRTQHDDRGRPADTCIPASGWGCGAGGDAGAGPAILLFAALLLWRRRPPPAPSA